MVQDAYWWNIAALPQECAMPRSGLLRPSLKACVWCGLGDCYREQKEVLWEESQANIQSRTSARCERKAKPSGQSVNQLSATSASVSRGGVTPFNVLPIPNNNATDSAGSHGHGAGTPLPSPAGGRATSVRPVVLSSTRSWALVRWDWRPSLRGGTSSVSSATPLTARSLTPASPTRRRRPPPAFRWRSPQEGGNRGRAQAHGRPLLRLHRSLRLPGLPPWAGAGREAQAA